MNKENACHPVTTPDISPHEEDILFAPEEPPCSTDDAQKSAHSPQHAWKILIVDDESDIHKMTELVLTGFHFRQQSLKILNAYSAQEAKLLLRHHSDIALLFLDVVMESTDAGLQLVRHIREELDNHFIRIILRTGQAGYAPEQDVVNQYDINDYLNKAELTAQKILTVVTASLRTYSDIMIIEAYRQDLENKVAERTYELQQRNTELIKLNDLLTEKNEQLTFLNQEKNEFLGIAAHDLKNPLSAIQGLAELISSDFEQLPTEEVIDIANNIATSSQRMFTLIKELLDVNIIESGGYVVTLERIDIFPIIKSLMYNYEEMANAKQLTIQLQHAKTQYEAFIDENYLRQILDNLMSNAIKYSPFGKPILIQLNQFDNYIQCEVHDQGPGLSQADQSKLFGKFSRLAAQPTAGEHSTGLGLYIVKKLVKEIKGKVWCTSELGKGSTFTVQLNCCEHPHIPAIRSNI